MDETSGTVVTDASGSGNTGTISGGVTHVTGKIGGALSFNGTTGRVTVADSTSLDITHALTVAAWVRSGSTGTQYLVKKADIDATNGYELSLADTGKPFFRLNQASSGNTYRVNGPSPIAANGSTWVHLAGVYDGTTMTLYVNGVAVASAPGPASIGTNSGPLVMGDQPSGGYPFLGALDDVRVYDRALSASEIATLAAG